MSLLQKEKQAVLYINSMIDRLPTDELNSNKFTTYLSQPIRTYSGNIKVRPQTIEVPNTWYSFPSYDSKIWFIEDVTGTPILRSISINTNKVYTSGTALADDLNISVSFLGYQVSFYYSEPLGKLMITNDYLNKSIRLVSSYRYTSDPYVSQISDDAHDRLGFNIDMTSQVIAPNYSLAATGVLRLLRTQCCYITLDLADGHSTATGLCPSNYRSASNVIAKIPCGNWGNVSQIQIDQFIEYPLSEKNITAMSFSLLDDEFQPLSTTGSPITMSLIVSYI